MSSSLAFADKRSFLRSFESIAIGDQHWAKRSLNFEGGRAIDVDYRWETR